jgi:hypothetical protein
MDPCWKWIQQAPPKHKYGVISWKTGVFTSTDVRTSNLASQTLSPIFPCLCCLEHWQRDNVYVSFGQYRSMFNVLELILCICVEEFLQRSDEWGSNLLWNTENGCMLCLCLPLDLVQVNTRWHGSIWCLMGSSKVYKSKVITYLSFKGLYFKVSL